MRFAKYRSQMTPLSGTNTRPPDTPHLFSVLLLLLILHPFSSCFLLILLPSYFASCSSNSACYSPAPAHFPAPPSAPHLVPCPPPALPWLLLGSWLLFFIAVRTMCQEAHFILVDIRRCSNTGSDTRDGASSYTAWDGLLQWGGTCQAMKQTQTQANMPMTTHAVMQHCSHICNDANHDMLLADEVKLLGTCPPYPTGSRHPLYGPVWQ